jgi:integrase
MMPSRVSKPIESARQNRYDLRHTCATLLLSEGEVPVKVVQEILGHSSVSITMDVYSHVLPDMQEKAAAVMDSLLSGRH